MIRQTMGTINSKTKTSLPPTKFAQSEQEFLLFAVVRAAIIAFGFIFVWHMGGG